MPLTTVAAVMNAERIKLTTVRSPLWSTAVAAALSFGIAALRAATAYDYEQLTPPAAALGVAVFGVPVLMVVAAMTVTGEYRTGMVRTTFMASPNRTLVLVAKAVVAAAFSGISAAIMVLGSILVARVDINAEAWRTTAAVGLYAALAAVLGVGVAALLRHTAGAVSVLLLWPLLVEPLLGNLPGRGSEIGPYLPFANVFRFLDVQWLFPTYATPWGVPGSLGYFAAVVGAVFVVAVVVVNRRDA
ncbi:MAG: ABC transporter permease [Mycobacterium sp.]